MSRALGALALALALLVCSMGLKAALSSDHSNAAVMQVNGPEPVPPHGAMQTNGPEPVPPHGIMQTNGPEPVPPHGIKQANGPEPVPPHPVRDTVLPPLS
jgi:hypothetical protein